ncbi:MAG TPA: phosphotransferase [Novosphingobium sp.]
MATPDEVLLAAADDIGIDQVGDLPVERAEITREFMEAALSEAFPGVRLDGVTVDDAHHGFSTVWRVHLDADEAQYAAGLPRRVMLKGQFEAATRARKKNTTNVSLWMEYHGYQFLPELGLNIPRVFFKALQQKRQQVCIVMEDLTLRGARLCRGLSPNSPEQVRRRLTALADLHARTWGGAEVEDGGRYGGLPINGARIMDDFLDDAGYHREGWYEYAALPRGQACPVRFQDYDWARRAMQYAARLSDSLPQCVIHGDTHLGNCYEDADGAPGFFDSLLRREPGISEACYHIVNALDPIDRRAHDRDLIAHYRAELAARGVAVPPLAEMMEQYAGFIIVNFVTFIVNEAFYHSEAFNTAHAVRAAVAMMDHDVWGMVG